MDYYEYILNVISTHGTTLDRFKSLIDILKIEPDDTILAQTIICSRLDLYMYLTKEYGMKIVEPMKTVDDNLFYILELATSRSYGTESNSIINDLLSMKSVKITKNCLINSYKRGDIELVKYFSNYFKADKYIISSICSFNFHISKGRFKNVVSYAMEEGYDINIVDLHDMTPLMRIARTGSYDKVNILIDLGADLSANNNKGETALVNYIKNTPVEKINYNIIDVLCRT